MQENTPPTPQSQPVTLDVAPPKDPAHLLKWMRKQGIPESVIKEQEKLLRDQGTFIGSLRTEEYLDKFVTGYPPCETLKEQVRTLAPLKYPVLIRGETGTGKELIANALHGNREGRFSAINTTALPDYLLESEFFGHKRGSFTGAVEDKAGILEASCKGTVFLDEIGDMPLQLQAKLLRVLQEMRARRVGANEDYALNFRLVCATHQCLEDLVAKGKFREDLYQRISTFELFIPALKERMDDCRLIALALQPKFPVDFDWSKYPLRGNVRAIQKVVIRWEVFGELPDVSNR